MPQQSAESRVPFQHSEIIFKTSNAVNKHKGAKYSYKITV